MGEDAGTIAFLFTDVEDSTALWDRFPEAMAVALRSQRELLEEAIEAQRGDLVKDTGDGVFAVFGEAIDAVNAALQGQQALARTEWGETGPLRVRMGVHLGHAQASDGDYHGPDVNVCARIMGAAHGGQTLVSGDAVRAVGTVEDGFFDDLGEHRLKGVSRRVRLHQLGHRDLRQAFPPPRTLDGLPNNLPAELSHFIGRDEEIADLVDLIGASRLVTLTGAGGSGKTRLAVRVGAELLERFDDGVWFVDLAGLGQPGLVPREVAATLGVGDQPGRSWTDSVCRFLGDRTLLLVVDNCEHVLDSTAELLATILECCPAVRALATSRESLNLSGEVAWRVPSMSIPTPRPESVADLEATEAGRLFLDRARAARPGFDPTGDDLRAIAEVCRRLDGLPLGLELAAARLKALSPGELASHLDDRFRLLVGGSRAALARQRTLEATVSWSYQLLEPEDRALFERLSVFAGSFSLDAAERVCDQLGIDVLDGVVGLVEKSLLETTASSGSTTRYRLLETLRTYGRDRLAESGAGGEARAAHAAWAVEFATEAGERLDGPDQSEWLTRVDDDLDNVRIAMEWSSETGDPTPGLVIAASLYRYWFSRAVREGREWLDRLMVDAGDVQPEILGPALFAHGPLLQVQGENQRSADQIRRALRDYERTGDEAGRGWALHHLARAEWGLGDVGGAKAHMRQAFEAFRGVDHALGLGLSMLFLRGLETYVGNVEAAQEMTPELETMARRVGSPSLLAHVDEFTGVQWAMESDFENGAPYIHSALERYEEIGNRVCIAHCLENSAHFAVASGDAESAGRLIGATDALREHAGVPVPPWENFLYEYAVEACRRARGDAAFEDARSVGARLSLDDAVRLALASVAACNESMSQSPGRSEPEEIP